MKTSGRRPEPCLENFWEKFSKNFQNFSARDFIGFLYGVQTA